MGGVGLGVRAGGFAEAGYDNALTPLARAGCHDGGVHLGEPRGEGCPDVGACGRIGGSTITSRDSRDDSAMLFDRRHIPPGNRQRRIAQQGHRFAKRIERLQQKPIVRGAMDGRVKRAVRGRKLLRRPKPGLITRDLLAHGGDFNLRRVLGCERGSGAL